MAALIDTVLYSGHSRFDGNCDYVQRHQMACTDGRLDQFDRGLVREDGLGDERRSCREEFRTQLGSNFRRIVGVRRLVAGPSIVRDLVGIDERKMRDR